MELSVLCLSLAKTTKILFHGSLQWDLASFIDLWSGSFVIVLCQGLVIVNTEETESNNYLIYCANFKEVDHLAISSVIRETKYFSQ